MGVVSALTRSRTSEGTSDCARTTELHGAQGTQRPLKRGLHSSHMPPSQNSTSGCSSAAHVGGGTPHETTGIEPQRAHDGGVVSRHETGFTGAVTGGKEFTTATPGNTTSVRPQLNSRRRITRFTGPSSRTRAPPSAGGSGCFRHGSRLEGLLELGEARFHSSFTRWSRAGLSLSPWQRTRKTRAPRSVEVGERAWHPPAGFPIVFRRRRGACDAPFSPRCRRLRLRLVRLSDVGATLRTIDLYGLL